MRLHFRLLTIVTSVGLMINVFPSQAQEPALNRQLFFPIAQGGAPNTVNCGGLVQEAEDAITLAGEFMVGQDKTASGGQYIYTPEGVGNNGGVTKNASQAVYCFNITTAGEYRLQGRVLAINSGSDSFFIQVNDAPAKGYTWHIPVNTQYQQVDVTHNGNKNPLVLDLDVGAQMVTFFMREDGARLDKIALEAVGKSGATPTPTLTATPTPEPTTTPTTGDPPVTNEDIYWSTDHETGDFSEWEAKQGQAIFNSNTPPGTSDILISTDVARSGQYSTKMALTKAENGLKQGARIFRRWLDSEEGLSLPTEAYYSAWYFFPEVYTPDDWWNVFQYKSKGSSSEPMFSFNIDNDEQGNMVFYIWDKANGGISHNQVGAPQPIPVGQWVHLEIYFKTSFNKTGQVTMWQDGVQIIDVQNIRTILGEDERLHWSVNNYTDGITPSNPVIYVDDVAISKVWLGPN
ncbi:MAG: heparin lyase I family protein [Chloroflexota bacterium]